MQLLWLSSVGLLVTMAGKAVGYCVVFLAATRFGVLTTTRLSYVHLVLRTTAPPLTPISTLLTSQKQTRYDIERIYTRSSPLKTKQSLPDVGLTLGSVNPVSSVESLVFSSYLLALLAISCIN